MDRIPRIPPKNCHPERSESAPAGSRSRRTPRSLIASLRLAPCFLCTVFAVLIEPPTLLFAQTAQNSAPTHTFRDSADHLSFTFPSNWTFAEQDHEISTFHLDARTAPRSSTLRAVVAMPQNPFPESTFSGAYLYFSVTPHSSASACARQAVAPPITRAEAARRSAESSAESAADPDSNPNPDSDPSGPAGKSPAIPLLLTPDKVQIAGIPFTHGRDQQRDVCITQHDDVYTTLHAGACLRFDLAINNFCGGEVSGVHDITPAQLDQVRARLLAILSTLHLDPQ